MVNINHFFSLYLLVILAAIAPSGQAAISCNPVVEPVASDTTLVRTLSRVAEEYEFELSLPESLDHPISFKKSMTLERLVKRLTKDMNTILKHKNIDNCATPVLTHLIVLPVGKEAGDIGSQQSAQEQPVDYIYIDDMESYVTSVLAGKQKADLGRMTPEQREEFKILREALATNPGEKPSQTENNNIGDSDNKDTDQTAGETIGN